MGNILVCENLSSFVNEETWNYHYGSLPSVDNLQPYGSESKISMSSGRDTGHFGSGLYLSTFKGGEDSIINDNKYSGLRVQDLVQLNDNLYRLDIDSYTNLFKPGTPTEAEWVFKMLKSLNEIYNLVVSNIKSGNSADYLGEDQFEEDGEEYVETGEYEEDGWPIKEYRTKYKKIKPKIEKYYEEYVSFNKKLRYWLQVDFKLLTFSEICQLAGGLFEDKSNPKSLSTMYMEMNGYNGVNVSGIKGFDNTTHGSVIYDVNKKD